MLLEQGLLSDCGNNCFQMNSCILAGSIQTTPQVSSDDSEAKPLIFTFVPIVRRLPIHSQLTDTSKFVVKIPEEASDKNSDTVNRSNSNEYLTLKCRSQQKRDREALIILKTSVKTFHKKKKDLKQNKTSGMQHSDLFKAEYVFIVDSEGEDEGTNRKGEQTPQWKRAPYLQDQVFLAISSSLVSDIECPKSHGVELQAPSHSEITHGTTPQQKSGQLTSPTTTEQHACKPRAFSFVSPTNQKIPPHPVTFDRSSVLEEFHTRKLDISGAMLEETTTYFQTSAHSSPLFASKGTSSTLQFPQSTQLSGSSFSSPSAADQKPGQAPEVLKMTKSLTSHVLSPRESSRTSSPPSSSAFLKSNSASYIPVRIVMHLLSPSPKPFTTSFHGSSSTICSQMSSSGNLSKSGLKSEVPSRLSLLTAILKSNPSHQRSSSPASCPTFSLNSLTSSTITLDQDVKKNTAMPKKSLSSCSLRAGSPNKGETLVPEFTQQTLHFPFFSKLDPLSKVPALSPTKHTGISPGSLNVEKTLSSTSWKNNPTLSLQPNISSTAGLPPVTQSLSSLSSKDKHDGGLRCTEKPKNIYMYPSTSTFSAVSSVSPTNQGVMSSSPDKSFHPSPALSNLINRSMRTLSGQGQTPSSIAPVSSASSSDSLRSLEPLPLPRAHLSTQAIPFGPLLLPPNCDSSNLPSRLGKSESLVFDHRSSVTTPPPPISLRGNELISPCALAKQTDPENKTSQQYKTKSSYKAFTAIPTNIFLLEQKALDKPLQTESISKDNVFDPPLEFCFPAQLRKQTEELCATIDKVLQDSLSMMPTTLPRAAGRETKYANLSSLSSTVSESQLTKPGVIRPAPVKSKLLLKQEEEIYEPNPFSKYLEESTELFTEQPQNG
ncbi:LOW QUALITY PROTEIN: muscular LMNA-interacting protein [Suncus etruscus]|uniref:LOW QUALITY PROTEIN: muscular LMNA-interacting protein n=1 Tax=Suncus etruscus TaxID=109475 RepID=UPI00210FF797|nr:LOW QUALITY PROTEIN: muscular LMNA-interacting protein [Suncus etruscus]